MSAVVSSRRTPALRMGKNPLNRSASQRGSDTKGTGDNGERRTIFRSVRFHPVTADSGQPRVPAILRVLAADVHLPQCGYLHLFSQDLKGGFHKKFIAHGGGEKAELRAILVQTQAQIQVFRTAGLLVEAAAGEKHPAGHGAVHQRRGHHRERQSDCRVPVAITSLVLGLRDIPDQGRRTFRSDIDGSMHDEGIQASMGGGMMSKEAGGAQNIVIQKEDQFSPSRLDALIPRGTGAPVGLFQNLKRAGGLYRAQHRGRAVSGTIEDVNEFKLLRGEILRKERRQRAFQDRLAIKRGDDHGKPDGVHRTHRKTLFMPRATAEWVFAGLVFLSQSPRSSILCGIRK